MNTDPTRLFAALMLSAALAVPAAAQTATDAPAADAGAGTESAPTEDNDDDDEKNEAPAADAPVYEAGGQFDYGFSGILARQNRTDLAPLTLSSGQPVAGAEYRLKSGGYYRIAIQADGTQELSLSGGDFFRAIWVNEVVINDIEIRPLGIHSIEFDAAGEARISFVAMLPGRFTLSIPGSSGDTMQAVFHIQ